MVNKMVPVTHFRSTAQEDLWGEGWISDSRISIHSEKCPSLIGRNFALKPERANHNQEISIRTRVKLAQGRVEWEVCPRVNCSVVAARNTTEKAAECTQGACWECDKHLERKSAQHRWVGISPLEKYKAWTAVNGLQIHRASPVNTEFCLDTAGGFATTLNTRTMDTFSCTSSSYCVFKDYRHGCTHLFYPGRDFWDLKTSITLHVWPPMSCTSPGFSPRSFVEISAMHLFAKKNIYWECFPLAAKFTVRNLK